MGFIWKGAHLNGPTNTFALHAINKIQRHILKPQCNRNLTIIDSEISAQ